MKNNGELPKAPEANCHECPLVNRPYVPGYFPEDAEIAIIGEGPGFHETVHNTPFVGHSGQLLEKVFSFEGIPYDKVWRNNVVACQPPNNRDPTTKEISCCSPKLVQEFDKFHGNKIIPLGKVAGDVMLSMAGYSAEMKVSERRGHWFKWDVVDDETGEEERIYMLPTWHPAYVLRTPERAKEMFGDIRRMVQGMTDHWLQDAPTYEDIITVEELGVMLTSIPSGAKVAFDLETDQVMWYDRPDEPADDILMCGWLWEPMNGYIIHPDVLHHPEGKKILNEVFQREDLEFIAQNGKFDVLFLRAIGINARVDFDTMLAHYAIQEETGGHGLKDMALYYYGLEDYERELVQLHLKSRNDRYSKVPYDDLAQYCTWDVAVTRQLRFDLQKQMEAEDVTKLFYEILMPLQASLTNVEERGVHISREHVYKWQRRLEAYGDDLTDEMSKIAEDPSFNPRSPMQVSHVLYTMLGVKRPRMKGVKPTSTSKKALSHVSPGEYEFVDTLRIYRRLHKMDRSYLIPLLRYADLDDKVHPNALIHGTEVGRLSFRNPAIQTIPRPYEDMYGAIIRSAFVAPPGYKFIIADYSQAELRVAGILSREQFLIQVYAEGRDLHTEVAVAMFGEDFTQENRAHSKMFNFSYLYGGSEYSFAKDAGLPIEIARGFVRRYNELMPTLQVWKREQFMQAKTKGYVTSFFGRRRRFPLITHANQEDVRKAAAHAPVAGTASDLTQISLWRAEQKGHQIALTVHDSNGEIAPEDIADEMAEELRYIMLTTAEEYFPEVDWDVDVDISDRWCPLPEEIHTDEVRRTFGIG